MAALRKMGHWALREWKPVVDPLRHVKRNSGLLVEFLTQEKRSAVHTNVCFTDSDIRQ
jgi:hypothetical protein